MDNNTTGDALQLYKTELERKAWMLNSYMDTISEPLAWTLVSFGVLGNLLSTIVLLQSGATFAGSFRRLLLATAVLDLWFLLAKTFIEVHRKFALNLIPLFMSIDGLMYSLSLLSDYLALSLTTERFLAFLFPLQYRNMLPKVRRRTWTLVIVACVVISLTRLHYSFSNFTYTLQQFDGVWLAGLEYFSDTIVPVTMVIACFFLVVGLIYMTVRRRKDRMAVVNPAFSPNVNSNNVVGVAPSKINAHRNMNYGKIISLVIAIFSACFINQLGYVSFAIGEKIFVAKASVASFNSVRELDVYYESLRLYIIFGHFSTHAEVLSRSVGFYLYVSFNQTFRSVFRSTFVGLYSRFHNSSSAPA